MTAASGADAGDAYLDQLARNDNPVLHRAVAEVRAERAAPGADQPTTSQRPSAADSGELTRPTRGMSWGTVSPVVDHHSERTASAQPTLRDQLANAYARWHAAPNEPDDWQVGVGADLADALLPLIEADRERAKAEAAAAALRSDAGGDRS